MCLGERACVVQREGNAALDSMSLMETTEEVHRDSTGKGGRLLSHAINLASLLATASGAANDTHALIISL